MLVISLPGHPELFNRMLNLKVVLVILSLLKGC